jgi:MFS family permease
MLGTTLPTPLYVIYQAQWHFSAAIVTVTFAVYAAGVLTALLLAGRSSGAHLPRGRAARGSHAVQGAIVFLLMAVGTVTQLLLSRFNSRRVMLAGLGLFLAALALIVAALTQAALALFLAGTVVGGAAVGAVFLGSLATANRLAPPGRRGQVVSAYFVLCYCGLIIPVVGVGVASGFIGDFRAAYWFMGGPGVDPNYNGTTAEARTWGARQAARALSDIANGAFDYNVVWMDIELPGITPARDNGWNSVYTSPCSGVVKQSYVPTSLDRADFDGFLELHHGALGLQGRRLLLGRGLGVDLRHRQRLADPAHLRVDP